MGMTYIYLAACLLIFAILARLVPCNPGQRAFPPPEILDDTLFYVLAVSTYGVIATSLTNVTALALFGEDAPAAMRAIDAGRGAMAGLPLAGQILLILFITDFFQYWLHRWLHGRALWPFHAIHHSAREVDWTTTFRVHPVNWVIYVASLGVLTRLMGFSPMAFAIIAPLNLFIGAIVHANVAWTFGPLRYVIASPVFHRWHHSLDPAVRDKNFAPTFPILDLMFGTFHMPKDRLPATYGAEGVPAHFLGQLVYPFAEYGRRWTLARKSAPAPAA